MRVRKLNIITTIVYFLVLSAATGTAAWRTILRTESRTATGGSVRNEKIDSRVGRSGNPGPPLETAPVFRPPDRFCFGGYIMFAHKGAKI
jgi:hypothetical protein